MPIAIRAATLSDVPKIRALEQQAASASHWTVAQYSKLIESGIVLLAEWADTPCGFITAQAAGEDWEIENAVTAAEFQRQGIASKLIGEIFERARNANRSKVFLEVRASNRAARSLYEKLGFIEVGSRRGYYSDPAEDGILFAKIL
jgi:ribosomal-protein-alanine N-acetyltransferase